MAENYYGLVNKPPIDEIYNLSLVNKPDLSDYDSELAHFGILGMKWGVRRYQNADGTLTEAGKARLAKRQARSEEVSKRKALRQIKQAERKAAREKKRREKILSDPAKLAKHQNEFTTEELTKAKERLWVLNDISKVKAEKIMNGKKVVDNLLAFGDTINSGIRFLNSPAGKGIRKSMGLSTEDWLKFEPAKSSVDSDIEKWKKKSELQKYKMQFAQWKWNEEHPDQQGKKKGDKNQ